MNNAKIRPITADLMGIKPVLRFTRDNYRLEKSIIENYHV